MARLESNLGYSSRSRERFISLVEKYPNDMNLLIAYADVMMSWGDFYKAEKIYQRALEEDPKSVDRQGWVVDVYIAMQRYDEAEVMSRSITDQEISLLKITVIKKILKDYESAICFVNEILKIKPGKI